MLLTFSAVYALALQATLVKLRKIQLAISYVHVPLLTVTTHDIVMLRSA